MWFDINVLINKESTTTEEQLLQLILSYLKSMKLDNEGDVGGLSMTVDRYDESYYSYFGISLPGRYWKKLHAIDFYDDFLELLTSNKIFFREVYMNLEESGSFFSMVQVRKDLNESAIGYFHYIRKVDIDSTIMEKFESSGKFVIKDKGEWWFIFKKQIDDLK